MRLYVTLLDENDSFMHTVHVTESHNNSLPNLCPHFSMSSSCLQCKKSFEIMKEDLEFLEKLSPEIGGKRFALPPPTLCPDCRLQRRLAHVNQLNLYERTCDLSGATVISNHHPKSPYKVYRQEDWHSDKWEGATYGRPFDFSRPFFEQYQELSLAVPRPNLFTGYEFDENSQYTNHAGKNKNCYLIFDSDENRDCYYSYSINHCVNCSDCFRTRRSELCYECVDCVQCYGSGFLQDCENCSDSLFLKNCIGCRSCLMCSNLKNKEYHVENKPVSKEEYEKMRDMLSSHSVLQNAAKRFAKLKLEHPQKYMHGTQNENVTGDYLVNCKNAFRCFDTENLWDGRYVYQGFMPLKDCMDVHECGEGELLYECSVAGYQIQRLWFSAYTLAASSDQLYCQHCPHSKHCFGCIGIRRKEYCLLNTQYSQEEYDQLVPKIIKHMQKTGEWGQFFPISLSTFGYNQSLAQDYYPLEKKDVMKHNWAWFDEPDSADRYLGPQVNVPERIQDVTDDITKQILTCETSGKQFKIIPQELALYRQLRVPLPRNRFFERHRSRLAQRNPRTLHARSCDNCKTPIETTYATNRPEKIYCESCYQQSLI